MDKLTIWAVDVSTMMTYGSDWVATPPPFTPDFVYEPWSSTLAMLRRFWRQADWHQALVAMTEDPTAENLIAGPPADTDELVAWLTQHGPRGWYDWSGAVDVAVNMAIHHSDRYAAHVVLVNRGPVTQADDRNVHRFIALARSRNVAVHTVPAGNEPNARWPYPRLEPLGRLAAETGGRLFYEPSLDDITDFAWMPALVPELIEILGEGS